MDFDSWDSVIRFPAEDSELAVDEKSLMVPNKLIIKLKVGDNNRQFIVHGDKEHKEQAVLAGFAGTGGGCFSRKSYNLLVKDEKPTCSLCGKTFPSRKSLFGHMRCHPDRDYRGMHPPDAFKFATRSQPLTVVDDQVNYDDDDHHHQIDCVELLRRLPGWSVKAKRSCISAAMEDYNEDEMVKGAVYGLMLMATGNDRYRYVDDDKIRDEDKLQKTPISNKKPRLVHGSTSDQEQKRADSDNIKIDPSGIESDTFGKKRKRQTAKVKDSDLSDHQIKNPDDAAAAAKCYKCSICDKTFATHQALGGHKSSAHYKHGGLGEVKTHQFDHQEGIHDAFVSSQPPPPPPAPATTVSEVGHKCKTCDKAFPSGQALGGHMRRHWPGPAPPLSSSSLASLPGQVPLAMMSSDGPDHSGSSTASAETRPVLVFDLNQLPTEDTEEQG